MKNDTYFKRQRALYKKHSLMATVCLPLIILAALFPCTKNIAYLTSPGFSTALFMASTLGIFYLAILFRTVKTDDIKKIFINYHDDENIFDYISSNITRLATRYPDKFTTYRD
ncbi:hypothetical protein [Xenorhabdus sp. KJ12.1]|uniref:hypothetical protein n=1 Tax=Xenorhabdus sp. KJ12.1 TaxID=1851571 RepID=UPI000C064DAB|nr:hypothetical protein [Xenorhabdus sp. KJ12.1]PHM72328.1 hypothetical protein Xekj_00606 [Xenorhabdus sp. KJ12.1]